MAYKIFSDDDLLDPKVRMQIVKEIEGPENINRKMESLKRYEIYKDKTKKYVLDMMAQEFDEDTMKEIRPRTANVSVAKTVVNKKARVYNGGVKRESENEEYTDQQNDPTPQIGFASSTPQLEQYMKMIEQYIGLLLTTNGLSPATISNKLDVGNFSSGVHELISKSEVNASVEDEQEYYGKKEKELMEIIAAWQNLYFSKNLLEDEFKEIGLINEPDNFSTIFAPVKGLISELDQLAIIEKRKELGLDSMVDSLMLDNPDMTKEEAEEKLKLIMAEKLKQQRELIKNSMAEENSENGETVNAPID